MSDQQTIAKNSVYNIIGSFSPMLVTLVTVPLYIEQIGEGRYGILALVWLLLGYFGLFDLGLGKAVANQIAYYKEKKNARGEEKKIFWTAFYVNLVLGIIGGLILFFLAPSIIHQVVNQESQYLPEVINSLPVLAASVPIITLSSIASGFFSGKEQFGTLNLLQVIRDVLFQIFPLTAAYFIGPELLILISGAVLAKLCATLLLFGGVGIKNRLGSPLFHKEKVKELLTYGGSVTITNIVGPILTSVDRFIIGALAGAKAVTWYTIPFNLASKVNRITSSFSRALFPKFSLLKENEAKKLSIQSVNLLVSFITPAILVGYLLMEPFLTIWLGQELAGKTINVGLIILMGIWINNMAFIPNSYLQGQRRPGMVALIHTFELLPFLLILWFMVKWWGVEGAAFAWCIRVAMDAVLLFYYSDLLKHLNSKFYYSMVGVTGCFLFVYYQIVGYHIILSVLILGYIIYAYAYYKPQFLKLIKPLRVYLSR